MDTLENENTFLLFVRFPALMLSAVVLCGCSFNHGWQPQFFAFASPVDPPHKNAVADIVALRRVSISPLFQHRSFTYRTAENTYKQDPYACFLIPPERALAESIRACMRAGGAFGRVVDPGSGLSPTIIAEVSINELCGDFRHASQPLGTMQIHFICYEVNDGSPGRIILDKLCARATPLTEKTSTALMTAWNADLHEIMEEINSAYAKANSHER
jgi:hypothetical protein